MTLSQQGIGWIVWVARVAVLLLVTPLHECAHGLAAALLGDGTARSEGRLTLNPLRHLDPVGSLLLVLTGFGWARPARVDPSRFRHPRRDMALAAAAGPLANILFAAALTVVLQVQLAWAPHYREDYGYYLGQELVFQMIFISLLLAVLNLLPIPPLDGSRVIAPLLPQRVWAAMLRWEWAFALGLVLVLLFETLTPSLPGVLTPALQWVTKRLLDALLYLTTPIGRVI